MVRRRRDGYGVVLTDHVLDKVRSIDMSADYKQLTNVTHNALWAVVAGWHEVTAAQHGNIGPIWAHPPCAA